MNDKLTFNQYFFKLYDYKIRMGEITFSQIGISKDIFNQLCNNREFVPTMELIKKLEIGMKLSKDEFDTMCTYLKGDI